MVKVKISTDSTADIPVELAKELNIEVVPLLIIHENKEYRDGIDLTSKEFFEILETSDTLPSSSCVPPYTYKELYEKVYNEGYTDLIHTTVNAKGSSTYQGAVMMRTEFYEDHPEAEGKFNIYVIDSTTYSMCYGYAVVQAARQAAAGASASEIIDGINDWLEHVRPAFLPMNLKFVKKSGRVSAVAAFVGDALGLKPVITFENGESKVITKIRGENTAIKKLLDLVESERVPNTPYILVYGKNTDQFDMLKAACIERFGQEPEICYEVGNIISINTGPYLVAVIYRR